jgi:phosphoenolpyruvate phosphomutase
MSLRSLLARKPFLLFIEAHNPLSAIIADRTKVAGDDGLEREFDGIWSSSLTDSTSRGLPDIEVLDVRSRLANLAEIRAVTAKPIIMDGDTGGNADNFAINARAMALTGVAAVIIEDKTAQKRNSLFGTKVKQTLAPVEDFCDKLARGKTALAGHDMMVIARCESLIAGLGAQDALDRAHAYVAAGADGIMIHSCQSSPAEVTHFAALFRERHPRVPLVCVPTTYNGSYAAELRAAGFNIVIYANHLLRAAYKSMATVASAILAHGRTAESEPLCISVSEILNTIPAGAPAAKPAAAPAAEPEMWSRTS